MSSLLNVLALLMLIFFIFSVLGVFMFKDITSGVIINDFANFRNFTSALMFLFRISGGGEWATVMYDCMDVSSRCVPGKTCGTSLAPLYFVSFVMIINYVMINLFILVII